MTVKEIIISLSQRAEVTQEELAARLGYKQGANIAVPLSRKGGMGMKVETLIRWVEALDAQIIVQPINSEEDLILDGEEEGVTYK